MENKVALNNDPENSKYTFRGGLYIVGISGITAIIAGLVTSYVAKKKGREYFKEFDKEPKIVMESPHLLACRALAWGTFWAVGICSLSVFGIWKWYDIKDMDDLRSKIKKFTRKSAQSEGRTEFENLSDFLNYLNETSKSKTNVKES